MAKSIAPEMERLPWLTDDRPPSQRKPGNRWLVLTLATIAMMVVAAFSYWVGMQRALPTHRVQADDEIGGVATTALPPVAPSQPSIARMPQVEPAPVPAVTLPRQLDVRDSFGAAPPIRRMARKPEVVAQRSATVADTAPEPAAEIEKKGLSFSNPWESAAASGRMVRVGTYSSLQQGKQAWARLAKVYPGMKSLPAVVTDLPSLRNGRVYYRLQIGTTSQAHSEVLCQRMRTIGQSCVVVDIAGARKGSGDERQPVGV